MLSRPVATCIFTSTLAGVLAPLTLAAQAAAVGAPGADTSAARSRASTNPWPQRGWISAGFGTSTSPFHWLAAVAAGWYSVGPVVTGVRLGGVAQWFGEQRSDQAFLMGIRTRGSRAFLLGAIGTAKVASSGSCDGPCSTTEMAYAFEAHANPEAFFGFGATMFGTLGPTSARYNAFAVTLDVGWFGP